MIKKRSLKNSNLGLDLLRIGKLYNKIKPVLVCVYVKNIRNSNFTILKKYTRNIEVVVSIIDSCGTCTNIIVTGTVI